MNIDYSLKNALTWRFVVVAILPLLIVSIVSFDFFTRETEHRLARENYVTAESIAGQIALQLREPQLLVREAARYCSIRDLDSANCSAYLQQLTAESPALESLYLVDAQGLVAASGSSRTAATLPYEQLSEGLHASPDRLAAAGPVATWSRTFFPVYGGGIAVALNYPLKGGTILAQVNLGPLLANFKSLPVVQQGHLLLLDQAGMLIYRFPQAASAERLDLQNLPPVEAVLQGKSRTASYQLNGKYYLGTGVRLPSVDWILLFGQEHSGLSNIVWRLRVILIGALLLAIFLAAVWAQALARKIVRPISDLARSAKSFAEGDYAHPLPYGNHLEIDRLSDSFRVMRKTIDERESLLLQNQDYFSRLFNGVTDAILVSKRLPDGRPGNFIEVNDVACRLLGYSREQLLSMGPFHLNRLSQEEPETFREVLDEIAGREQALFKTELRTASGDWLPVEIGSQLFELDGQQVYFSVARDITLRERYESSIKTLVRSTVGLTGQDCLEEIVRNLCDWLNADAASIGILTDDQLQLQAACLDGELLPAVRLSVANTPLAEVLNGNYCCYPNAEPEQLAQFQLPGLDGVKGFIGIPMIGYHGRVLGAVSVASRQPMQLVPHVEELLSVIASRAAAECERLDYVKDLAHSEEMLRTLFNSTAEAIVGLNLNGDCVFCNPSSLRLLGYAQESELIGQNFCKLVDNAQLRQMRGEECACPFLDVIHDDDKTIGSEAVLLRKDGQEIPVEFWGHRMERGGEMIGGVITFIDISRRRTLEKQLQHSQRMEAIGTLTGGIAHDFNNILTVISGYAGLLQSICAEDEKLLSKINKIAEAADRGSKLTHGLLAYSRKKTGPSTPVELNRLVLHVQELFGKVIGEHIDKKLQLCEEPLFVLADTSQLEQVLVNLATNARDAMPGGGLLTIATSRTTIDTDFCQAHGYGEPGDYALIQVRDTGVGIDPEMTQNIFDPFYTTKDTGKGTGLGLAIAWGIITQHKGYILVESEVGEGCCFAIYLPLTGSRPLEVLTAQNPSTLPGGSERILLVEDDPQVLDSTQSILTSVGYRVLTSSCAASALQTLEERQQSIDLILSDVVMPGIKGDAFYQEIRKRTTTPVIFISGYTFDALREQGLVGDEIVLLNKPIAPVTLLGKIREVLDLAKA